VTKVEVVAVRFEMVKDGSLVGTFIAKVYRNGQLVVSHYDDQGNPVPDFKNREVSLKEDRYNDFALFASNLVDQKRSWIFYPNLGGWPGWSVYKRMATV
jgi:hypothetical protein